MQKEPLAVVLEELGCIELYLASRIQRDCLPWSLCHLRISVIWNISRWNDSCSFFFVFGTMLFFVIAKNAAHRLGFVLLDNAPAHRNVENLDVELLNLKRLPKYTPFLNPAENAISCWKADFKKEISQRQREFIDISDEMRNGRTVNEYRFKQVRHILEIS